MKKIFDRRMIGYIIGVLAIVVLCIKTNEASIGLNMILGMFGVLVGGNVYQAIKEPKEQK